MKLFRALGVFCLLAGISAAHAFAPQDFSLEPVQKLDSSGQWSLWSLKYKGRAIGELQSIGGSPRMQEPEPLSGPGGRKLYVIRYQAGSAGTTTLTEWDRLLVLSATEGKEPAIALDIPLAMRRFQGRRNIETEQRSLKWNKDHSRLAVGALDEYRETRYVWQEGRYSAEGDSAKKNGN